MARFRGRAPYLRSMPSVRRNFLALPVTFIRKGLPALAIWTRCCTRSSSISMILFSSSLPKDSEHHDFVQTIEKLRRELPARCFYAGARQFSCQCGCAITVVRRRNMET